MSECCTSCHMVKEPDEFSWRNKAQGLRQRYCKSCKKQYNQTWYGKNKTKHMGDVARNKVRYREILLGVVLPLKNVPCPDCGIKWPVECMDFDHLPGQEKTKDISKMVAQFYAVEKVLEEIAKCEVICSNCHRIRTSRRSLEDKAPIS